MIDILIKNGLVADGSGAPAYRGNIAISDGKIADGHAPDSTPARQTIDASGCIVCPGFIDHHCHSDLNALVDPAGSNQLLQGVTTEVGGNCGISLVPSMGKVSMECLAVLPHVTQEQLQELAAAGQDTTSLMRAMQAQGMGLNMGCYVGHGAIRQAVMGYDPAAPSDEQIDKMCALLRGEMERGALGLSSGLIYPPGIFATQREMQALCRVVKQYGGTYTTHMRSESDQILAAMDEAMETAGETGVTLVLSHHKITGRRNWGLSEQTLGKVDAYRAAGHEIYLDQYPFCAGATRLLSTIPKCFLMETPPVVIKRLGDRDYRMQVRRSIEGDAHGENLVRDSGGLAHVVVGFVPGRPELSGLSVQQCAELSHKDPFDCLFDLIADSQGAAQGIYFVQGEEDLKRILRHPLVAIGTDGGHSSGCNIMGHPRVVASFPRVLLYARDEKLFAPEEAIRKMTSLPAQASHLTHKGLLQAGYDADVNVIDYQHLSVGADYAHPGEPNAGFRAVIVNGAVAVRSDAYTGEKAGRPVLHTS